MADESRVIEDIIYMSDTYKVEEAKEVEVLEDDGTITKRMRGAKFVEVEIAMTYTISQRENVYSFVNNINTHEGGTHVSGFRTALTRTINDIAKQMKHDYYTMLTERRPDVYIA